MNEGANQRGIRSHINDNTGTTGVLPAWKKKSSVSPIGLYIMKHGPFLNAKKKRHKGWQGKKYSVAFLTPSLGEYYVHVEGSVAKICATRAEICANICKNMC